jgi:hypothetical protein
MIYFWWNIWKERNRRTFQQKNPSTKTGGYALQRGHSTASVGNSQSSKLSVGLWLRLPFFGSCACLLFGVSFFSWLFLCCECS